MGSNTYIPEEGTLFIPAEKLQRFVVDLFGKYGMSEKDARIIADNLIDADMRGVTTHGLTRIPLYTEKFRAGLADPKAVPEVVRDFGATAVIDAKNSMGQVSGVMAMELAIEKAEQFGIGFVGVRNGCHYGTAGYYAMMAERKGMIGISATNSGAFVAPYGGVEKKLGTNPVAVAIPAKDHDPVLLDMATSRVSRGKLLVAMKKQEPVPDDWALDPEGNKTTDAAAGFKGILLPLSYKGYGQAVVIDMLAGILMGSGCGTAVDLPDRHPVVGSNFMAIKIDAFTTQEELEENVDALIRQIKASKKDGETEEIMMPGEIEFNIERENRKRGGVPVQPFQVKELNEEAARFGFTFERYL